MAAAPKYSKFDPQQFNGGLNVVYPNDEQTSSKIPIKLDIIAIPGLGASEFTWIYKKDEKERVHWLRDPGMLARKIPNARISIFQYQSQWFGKGSINQRLESVANSLLHALDRSRGSDTKTPIIFVCHCLGGIILEKALLTARLRQNDFPYTYPYVTGCIFLGTPFRGTNTQTKAMILAELAENIGWATPSSLLRMLEKDSDILIGLLEDFEYLAKEAQIRLFCFFEENKSDLTSVFRKGLPSWLQSKELVVDETSATLGSAGKLPLMSDHFQLNKFKGPKDSNFNYVADEIKFAALKADGILKSRQNVRRQALVNDRTYHRMIDYLGKGFQDVEAATKGSYQGPRGSKPSSVMELDSFKVWRDSSTTQVLWIHGKAGTGQGAVATSAIDHLEKSREHSSMVISFFCDQGDKQRRSLKGLLQLVVRQVIDLDQDLARHLLSDSRESKEAGKQDFDPEESLKVPALWEALHNMARDLPAGVIHIVIYGLEQLASDSLETFLHYMHGLPDNGIARKDIETAPIKWLLLSRAGRPNIANILKPKSLEINLENSSQVSDDLRTHVSVSVDELALPASLAYFVKRHIHSRAEDNWIYVSLVIQELKNALASGSAQYSDVRKLLESFPYGLTDMFEHVRKRVLNPQAESYEYTKELLRCRICAYVAPTMRELAVMAGLPLEDRMDLEKIKPYIVRCGAFLTLRSIDKDPDNNTVEWIDPSAQEHLERYAKADLSLDLNDMQHGIIALRSLEYIYLAIDQNETKHALQGQEAEADTRTSDQASLTAEDADGTSAVRSNNNLENSDEEEDDAAETDEENENETVASSVADPEELEALSPDDLRYPARYWVEHAKQAPLDVLDEFNLRHSFWQEHSKGRQSWWRTIEDVHGQVGQKNIPALHVAVILDFPVLVEYLLDHKRDSDIRRDDSLGFQPLYYACEGGEERIINALLGAPGTDINYVSDDNRPAALHAACSHGHQNIVKTLLDRDAEINATSSDNGTALYAAAANADIGIMKLLLKHRAQVNIIGGTHRRALNVAAFTGNLNAVRILIDHGADVDPNEEYWYGSALGVAARRGHFDVVKFLLSQGWDPSRPMKTYRSFLTAAATYNHLEVVELLLERESSVLLLEQALQAAAQRGYAQIVQAILDKTSTLRHQKAFSLAAFYGRTEVLKILFLRGIEQDQLNQALYQATDNEHEETVELLLDFNADPNAEGPQYGFALAASAYDGTTGIMKALLLKGADVNKRGGEFGTALQAAAWFGDVDNVKLLLEHNALINTEPIGYYGTELQAAVHTGDEATVRLLIERGANVNAHGGYYSYPIIAAVDQSDSTSTRILLEHDAHVNVRGGEQNWPVISLAASTLPVEDLKLIIKRVANIDGTCDKGTTALINCAEAGDAEGVRFLLANGANVHISSETVGTALHAAAAQGDEDCCKILLEAGADVNAIGGEWGTALQAAALDEDFETIQVLLDAGADVSKIAGGHGTALQAASAAGSSKIVQELLVRGARVNARPANGKFGNPLSAAAASGHKKIVKLLIEHRADVNAKGGHYGHPVLAAAQSGDALIVKLLLDRGSNASAAGGVFGSTIAAAAFGNNASTIQQLLAHGADVHTTGGKYGDALQAAAIKGNLDIVQDLINRAIDLVNHRDGKYHTALIAASYFNHADVVTKLLDAGSDFRHQGGIFRSAITAAAIRGNIAILDRFLIMKPPDQLLDEALVEACAYRQAACVDALLKAGANVYSRHPTLGLAMEILDAPEADGYNSDIEEDEPADDNVDDEEDDKDEDEENEGDEWEGDTVPVAGETDEGSVTDLKLEEEISNKDKIQRLLDEAKARCKRNPTVKRFRTVKYRHHPVQHQLSIPAMPAVPAMPSVTNKQPFPPKYGREDFVSSYGQHFQEPWSLPFRQPSGSEPQDNQTGQQVTANAAYPTPLFGRQQYQSPPSSPPRVKSPEALQQRHHSVPAAGPVRQSSIESASSITTSSTPPPQKGSEDTSLKRQSKAIYRRSVGNLSLLAQKYQQRQSSFPSSMPALDRSISEHDYAAPDQRAGPHPAASYPPPTVLQEEFRPALPPRPSQILNVTQQSGHQISPPPPPPSQYPFYTAPPERGSYGPYAQSSVNSSQVSVQGSQYTGSTMFDSPNISTRDTTTSMSRDMTNLGEAKKPEDRSASKWASGGYDGEGYDHWE